MRHFLTKLLIIVFVTANIVVIGPWVLAEQSKDIVSELSAFKVTVNAQGKEVLIPADKVVPGDVVEYQLVFTNKGKPEIKNLQPTLPIPAGLEYLPGTAKPVKVLASIDGAQFQIVPLKRQIKQANGVVQTVDVPYIEYRFLRWESGNLAGGDRVSLSARMKVIK